MFDKQIIMPEQAGVSSKHIEKYLKKLEKYGISTHSMIMLRGNNIFYENYWEPFNCDFMHRIYSETKSLVSIAVGFAIQDGLMSLDDLIVSYFDATITENASKYAKQQTVRNVLMMASGSYVNGADMFGEYDDFVKKYFDGTCKSKIEGKIPGTMFFYDSRGVTVLCAAVERVTGMPFMEYLREKLFKKIGVSDSAYCLKVPGGYSWGESGVLCTPRDMLKIALFTMNYGKWNGEQILNEEYLREATSNLISSDCSGYVSEAGYGYGYLIWRQQQNSFFFSGMGCQFSICVPDKKLIFIYNGDNQGNPLAKSVIIDNFYDIIVDNMSSEPIDNFQDDYHSLMELSSECCLSYCKGESYNQLAEKINGKCYKLDKNPMGIEWLKIFFNGDSAVMYYKNAQGEKTLEFGFGKNIFGKFPQEGYSDEIVPLFAPGHFYDCAASGEWQKENKLHISVQIIDKYFGRLHIFIDFKDETKFTITMSKTAENFLQEYTGVAVGYIVDDSKL